MDARFRIRTQEGEELQPRTLGAFSEMVRAGVVRPGDLVYDVLTGEWIPAGVHPMVRLFRDPLVSGATTEAFQLVDVPEVSPEAEARAFIERMDEERRNDPDLPLLARDVPLVQDRPGIVEGLVQAPGEPRGVAPAPRGTEPVDRPPAPRGPGRAGWRGWHALILPAGVAALVSVAYARGERATPIEGLARNDAPRAERSITTTEEDVRLVALRGFIASANAMREARAVGEVPDVWLEGTYLSRAAAHPDVRRYWEATLGWTGAVWADEAELYRAAYLEAAEEAGVAGPVRSLRLAAALEDFAAAAPARARLYLRMSELAAAALALHEALVELDGRVTYEPIRGRGLSADPVLEAAGSDPEAQALLEVSLDRVLRALRGRNGAPIMDRDRVSGWLLEALEEAGP